MGGLHVVFLVLEVAIPLLHPLKFLHCPQVYSAQGLYGLVQLNRAPLGLGRVLHRDPDRQRPLVGHAIGVPQPVQEAFFLHAGLQLSLLQHPGLSLQPQLQVILGPGRPVILHPGPLQGQLLTGALLQLDRQCPPGSLQGFHLGLPLGNLLFQRLGLLDRVPKQPVLAGLVCLSGPQLVPQLGKQWRECPHGAP